MIPATETQGSYEFHDGRNEATDRSVAWFISEDRGSVNGSNVRTTIFRGFPTRVNEMARLTLRRRLIRPEFADLRAGVGLHANLAVEDHGGAA